MIKYFLILYKKLLIQKTIRITYYVKKVYNENSHF